MAVFNNACLINFKTLVIPLFADVCLNPQNDGGTYEHFKSCKQYWQCENGVSVPRCCPGYLQYDIVKGECVPDPTEECSPADCYSTPGILCVDQENSLKTSLVMKYFSESSTDLP